MLRIYPSAVFLLIFFGFTCAISGGNQFDEDPQKNWSDLEPDNITLYGSEKDGRIKDLLLLALENWQVEDPTTKKGYTRFSLTVRPGLLDIVNYPKYNELVIRPLYILPVFYWQNSKIDKRYRWNFLNVISKQDLDFDYDYILPLFYRYKSNNFYLNTFLPFYFATQSRSIFQEQEKIQIRYFDSLSVSLLHFSIFNSSERTVAKGKTETNSESIVGFPLLPFVYFHHKDINNRISDNNYLFLSLFQIKTKAGHFEKFNLLPFLYYSKGVSFDFVPLFGFGSQQQTNSSEQYSYVLPFYYQKTSQFQNYDGDTNKYLYRKHYSLFHYFSSSKTITEKTAAKQDLMYDSEEYYFHFPLIPIYSYEKSGSRSTARLFLLTEMESRDGKFDFFALHPLFYWQKESFQLLLPLYLNLFGSSSTTSVGPLWYYYNSEQRFVLRMPIIPLMAVEKSGDDFSWHLLYLLGSYHQMGGSAFRLWPLMEFNNLENRYFLLPFFFYNKNEYRTLMMGATHFYFRSPDKKIFWLLPWFHYSNQKSKTEFNLLAPIFMNYRSENLVNGKKNPIFLHVNFTGISLWYDNGFLYKNSDSSKEDSTATKVAFASYQDFQFGFLYNLVGLSLRRSQLLDFVEKTENPENITTEEVSNQFLSQDELDSEIYQSPIYFKFDLFFGIFSYLKTSQKNYIRMLPLLWFQWSKEKSEKLNFVVPFYLRYSDDETDFLLSLFYSHYKTPLLQRNIYLLLLAWTELNFQENSRTLDILFPLFRSKQTETDFTNYLVPLFYYNRELKNNGLTFWGPLWYYRSSGNEENPRISSLNPLYIYNHKKIGNQVNTSWFVPLLLSSYSNNINSYSQKEKFTSPLFGYKIETYRKSKMIEKNFNLGFGLLLDNTRIAHDDEFDSSSSTSLLLYSLHFSFAKSRISNYIFPLYFYSHEKEKTFRSTNFLLTVPFLLWSSTQSSYFWNFMGLLGGSANEFSERSFLFLPLYFHSLKPHSRTRFLLGWYHHSSQYERYNNFLYLFQNYQSFLKDENTSSWNLFFNFIRYEKENSNSEFYFLTPLVFQTKSILDKQYSLNLGLFLFNYERTIDSQIINLSYLFHYRRYSDMHFWYCLPLLSMDIANYTEKVFAGEKDQFQLYGLLLWYKNVDVYEESKRILVLGGIFYNELRTNRNGYHSRGSLWGFLWQYDTEDNGWKKFSLLKFVYTYREKEGVGKHQILGIPLN